MSETVDETKKLQEPIILSTAAAADTSDSDSTGSSGEGGDDSEKQTPITTLQKM